MASIVFNEAKQALLDGTLDLDTGGDALSLVLLTDSYTPDEDDAWADMSAAEASGTGYTAGGESITGQVVTKDDGNDRAYFDFTDVTWASSTITARYAVVKRDSDDLVVCLLDFTSNQSSSAGNFTVQVAAPSSGGAMYLT
jgi:hypothetical protein